MNNTRISQLSKEDVLTALYQLSGNFHCSADCCLPERKIEHMMQAERNQGTFDDTENQSTDITCSRNKWTKRIDTVLNNRPDKEHQDTDKYEGDGWNDRHETAAAEEGQCVRQFDLIEFIMKRCNTKTDNNTAEYTHLQCLNTAHGSNRTA